MPFFIGNIFRGQTSRQTILGIYELKGMKINQLIWIRRVRDGGKGWYTDEEYSLMVVINAEIGKRYAYYNEAESFFRKKFLTTNNKIIDIFTI